MKRRAFFTKSFLLATYLSYPSFGIRKIKNQFGACDWSLGKTCNPTVFQFAKEIGLDGVQISYNNKRDEAFLSKPENQKAMKDASKKAGVKIASMAIGELNNTPLKSEEKTVEWITNAIIAAKALKIKVILLAFFSKGDLRNDTEGKNTVIKRLKMLAPIAEKNNVILGIESYLTAQEHIDIIEAVGSPNLKVYYDPRNATDAGNDPIKEIEILGQRNLICEVHLKENDFLLGQGSIDWPQIRKSLDAVGYRGWFQTEGSVPKGKTIQECYPQNLAFARKTLL